MDTNEFKAAAPGRSFVFLVIYLAGLSAFGSFVNDMYLPSLPSMMKFFGCTVSMVQMGLTMGMIGLAVGELVLGPVSDRYGRKPMLVWTLVAFCIASVVSIFSPSIKFFLVCRLFQGIGASGGYFLARSIPADIYSGRLLAKTMAIIGAINGIAPASAPVFGGIISDHFTWKGVFVALTVLGIVLLCFSPKFKESLTPDKRDKTGVWHSFGNYRLLLTNKAYMIHVFLKGAALGVMFAYISSAPFIIETHFGYSQTVFGLFMGGNALAVMAGSMIALRFKTLKSAAFLGAMGLMVFAVVEAAVLWLVPDKFLPYELVLLPMLFSMGLIFTAGNTLAMNEGRSTAGDASALLGIVGYIFGAVVSPLVGKGDIMHSTAIAFVSISVIVVIAAVMSWRLPAEINKDDTPAETK
ncbi:MAG: multidrug effflux MFS transporter [Muribaculaceae bacterium]|nr:multidrug effflux MFS transporter [Muribaculaceae bacterium]